MRAMRLWQDSGNHSLFVVQFKPQLHQICAAFRFSVLCVFFPPDFFFKFLTLKSLFHQSSDTTTTNSKAHFYSDVTMCQTFSAKFGKCQSDVYQWQLSQVRSVWGADPSWSLPLVNLTGRKSGGDWWRQDSRSGGYIGASLGSILGIERLIDLFLHVAGLYFLDLFFPIIWNETPHTLLMIPKTIGIRW